jgi:hypothetical protein
MMTVKLVVRDDFFGGSKEACAGFVGDEDCVDIAAEGILE